MERAVTILAAFLCAGCGTAGDVSLLRTVPMGSSIAPPERGFPAVPKFPMKIGYNAWTSLSDLAAVGLSGNDATQRKRTVEDVLDRARGYFETEGDFPTARIAITPAPPQFSTGAEAQTFGPSTSASKSVQKWSYAFTVEDWENPARPALTLSGDVEVVAMIKVTFEEMQSKLQEWRRATFRRGLQNALVDLVETLDRNRAQLAALSARYVAWRGRTQPAVDTVSRRERIRRVEDLLAEAERFNPGGAELAGLRRRLDAVRGAAQE